MPRADEATNGSFQHRSKRRKIKDKSSTYDALKAWILQLPGATEALHKLGGTEFQVNGVDFMHSHGPSWLDIRLSKRDQASVAKAGQALRHRAQVHAQAGWVSLRIGNSRDLANAKKVIQLAYENAKKNLKDVKSGRKQLKLR